jgi:hypothetical protein
MISLNVNWLVVVMATECVYWAVRTEFLCVVWMYFRLRSLQANCKNQEFLANTDALDTLNHLEVSMRVSIVSCGSVSGRGGLDSQRMCTSVRAVFLCLLYIQSIHTWSEPQDIEFVIISYIRSGIKYVHILG